jgi:hypothetical protein
MSDQRSMTSGEIAAHCNVPIWLVRRAIDAVIPDVQRVGMYRLVPRRLLPRIEQEIQRRRERAMA